ncbi:hypothetical protein PAPHI01_2676, partial [Pancytospora philotis]
AAGNYTTRAVALALGKEMTQLDCPYKRFTCLGEAFLVRYAVKIDFVHRGRIHSVSMGVLPRREDSVVILGREWLAEEKERQDHAADEVAIITTDQATLEDKLFAGNKSGIKVDYECPIPTKESEIVVDGTTKIPQAIERKFDQAVEELLEKDYIKPSNSSWCNRIRPVEKPDGTIRLTTNLIRLNQKVEPDRYSLPRIDKIIYALRGYSWFSKIDLKDGFFQVPLCKADQHKTAFRVDNRLYEWTRMPMGYKNAPAVFQRLVDRVLKEEAGKICFGYVDDILIFAKSREELERNTMQVVQRLVDAGLRANKEKCRFNVEMVDFLGYRLSKDEIRAVIDENTLVNEFVQPTNIEETRRFLGLVNYYRRFIPGCSTMVNPMQALLHKDVVFTWSEECEEAFQKFAGR